MNVFSKIKSWLKSYWQIILGLVCFFFALIFFAKSGNEIKEISKAIKNARLSWIYAGIALSVIYVLLQGFLYYFSFRTIRSFPTLFSMVMLFLKRFLISVVLPAGGITSLAFPTSETDKQNISKPVLIFGSSIYMFASCTSILLFSIPAIIITAFTEKNRPVNPIMVLPIVLIILAIVWIFNSYKNEGKAYSFLNRHYPSIARQINKLDLKNFSLKTLLYTFGISCLLDLTGICFAYSAMMAVTGNASLGIAFLAYVIVFIIGMISPFMNGLGAIETALTYLFKHHGIPPTEALLTALIYRLFSFWIPLIYSSISYVIYRDSYFLRIFPSIISLLLGITNIISLLFPLHLSHINFIKSLVSQEFLVTSDYLQFATGVILIINSVYLFKGYRIAWIIALSAAFLSALAHLTSGSYYEYSIGSLLIAFILIYTKNNYTLKGSQLRYHRESIFSIYFLILIFLYGVLGFYWMDSVNFGNEFTIKDAFRLSLKNILLIGDAQTSQSSFFGKFFILSLRMSSILCFLYITIILMIPLIRKKD